MSIPPPKIEYTHPGDIDADPPLVGDLAVDQFVRVMRQVLALHAETGVQLRSSYQSRLLDADPALEASEVALRWVESDIHNRWARTASYLETITHAVASCKLGPVE